MTSGDLAAIRAHVARRGNLTWRDGEDLLAEVDRLTAENGHLLDESQDDYEAGMGHERARILAAVEAELDEGCGCATGRPHLHRAAVLRAIEGEP